VGVVFFVINMVLGIAIPLAIQLLDRERMTREERAWVWGFASWGSALYNFGPLSLVAWGYVTRSPRYARGLAIGAAMAVGALALQGAGAEVIGRLLRFPAKDLANNRIGFLVTMGACVALAVVVGVGRAVYELVRRALRRGDGRSSG
jgi:hypothetical protein